MSENVIEKKWGREVILAREDEYAGKLLVIDPGKISSLHCHLHKTETFVVVTGECWFQHRDLILNLFEGDKIRVVPGEYHRFWSVDGATLLEISTKDDPNDNERRTLSGDILEAKENVTRAVDDGGGCWLAQPWSALVEVAEFAEKIGKAPKNVTFQE